MIKVLESAVNTLVTTFGIFFVKRLVKVPVILLYELFYLKRGSNTFAKSIDPGQPARSAQADLNRIFLL